MMNEILWSTQTGYPPLILLQLLPLIAAALIIALRKTTLVFPLAIVAALAEILIAIFMYQHYDTSNSALQFAERLDWLGWHNAVDGV
ncbi:hypothetical protein, partial [Candidatus Venteria ishoeyi]